MPTTQVNAVGQYQACFYRVWPLGADCAIVKAGGATGIANAIVGTGIVRANMAVETKAGAEIEAETACGGLAWYAKDVDRIKAWNLDFEVATWDYELLAYAVGGTLITGNGATETTWNTKTIGWAAPGPTATTQPAVAIELWSRAAYSTGACSTITGAPTFIRHIFPRVQMQLTDRAFEAGTPGYMKFQGRVEANPTLANDLKNAGVDDTPWIGPSTVTALQSATYLQMFAEGTPVKDNTFDGGYTAYTFV